MQTDVSRSLTFMPVSAGAVNGETIKTDYQVEVCSEELAERGARVGEVFTDPSLSAWRRDVVRPDWIKLMERLESG